MNKTTFDREIYDFRVDSSNYFYLQLPLISGVTRSIKRFRS